MSDARGLVAVVAAAAIAAVTLAVVNSPSDGLTIGALMVACGAAVVGAVQLLSRRRRLAGSLARQFMFGVGATVGLVTLGVAVVGGLMFISPHDALTGTLLLVFAGALSVYSVWVLSRGAMRDVETLRDGLRALGEGRRDGPIVTGANDELAELAVSANRMAAQLAEREAERDRSEQARRDLVAAVSHDLRTPLTSLRLLAEAVDDELLDTPTRDRYLTQMSHHIRALSALIEDLFELSRLEAGEIRWSMQQVMLDQLVEETVEAMRPQAAARGVMVRARIPTQLAPARADPEKLQRVLFNLIQNAIRHTPADGSVTVAAESNAERVEVEVRDSGEGVAPEEREAAFEPFYRGGKDESRSGDGSGLGLAICRAIVEGHGGSIWFADSSAGARIRFTLPLAQQPA